MSEHLLSLIIFLPLIGAATVLLAPGDKKIVHKYLALFTAATTFIVSTVLLLKFDKANGGMQFLESMPWVTSLNITYTIGVDGISIYLIPLTALIFVLAILSSWEEERGTKGFYSLVLFCESTLLGTMLAQDLFLFFTFWEASILPLYFLIGVWGKENRVAAATRLFLTQLSGSALLLLAMLSIYYFNEPHTFGLLDLAKTDYSSRVLVIGEFHVPFAKAIFALMLLGFAVRIPVFPLHGWFTSAMTQAPTMVAVILSALYVKTGIYGLLRINYALFPMAAQWLSTSLAIFGAVNIVYGAICAFGQKDLRRLVAYLTMSHVGFMLMGIGIFAEQSFHGTLYQMFAHAIYTSLLVFLIGILGSRVGHYNLVAVPGKKPLQGLVRAVPVLTGFFTIAAFSALSMPGLVGFPGGALILLGAFPLHKILTVIGVSGLLMTAGYILWVYKVIFLGEEEIEGKILDLSLREKIYLSPLVLTCIVAGVYPTPFINLSTATLSGLLGILK